MSKQKTRSALKAGFTIVELLIVIVVIGILAALAFASFANAQDKAKHAKQQNDFKVLIKAGEMARASSGATLWDAVGGNCVECPCRTAQDSGINLNTLPKSDPCWVDYLSFIDRLAAAANTKLDDLKLGNPWGAPYFIDLNESESITDPCRMDSFSASGKDGRVVFDPAPFAKTDEYDINLKLPFVAPPCI